MNERLANIFSEMAVEFKQDKYRKRAYENAADAIRRHTVPITSGLQAQREIKGIGKSIGAKIDEIIATGKLQFLTERPEIDIDKNKILELFKGIHGVGDVTANKWYELGYRNLEDLKGIYNSMTNAQKLGYYYYHHLNERIPRAEIDQINLIIGERWKNIEYEITGSYRRGEPSSGDIDILVKNNNLSIETLVNLLGDLIIGTLASGPTKYMGILKFNEKARRIDIRLVDEVAWPYALLYFTGSKQLNIEMRAKAQSMGLTMNEYGMVGPNNTNYIAKTERDIFNYLGMPYLEPIERSVTFKETPTETTERIETPVETEILPELIISPTNIQREEIKPITGKWHRPAQSLFLYMSDNIISTGNIAAFDLDWTLVRPIYSNFPTNPDDITLLPNRLSVLRSSKEKNYTIVIFTNQKSTTENKININFQRVNNFIKMIDIPIILLMSISDDIYRKPNIGMYQILQKMLSIKSAFYCGDAASRVGNFSDSDLKFAENVGIPFYLPEQIFAPIERLKPLPNEALNTIEFPQGRNMVLFVGMPGSGKTFYYNKYLPGYVHANQDILGTKAKVLKLTKESMIKGLNVVIDSTNPGQDRRQEFYNLASQYGYNIIVLYFVSDGKERNKQREKPVPTIAYSVYFKALVEPTYENTPGTLYQVMS